MTKERDLSLRLASIIDTAIDGIITIDAQGHMESVNKAACQIFQYSREELIGQNVNMLMPQPHKTLHDNYLSRYLLTKEPRIIGVGREVQGKKKNGTLFPFRLAVSEVILNDRIIFTGIIHDLTPTKKAEQDLKDLNTLLESKITQRTEELEVAINRLLKTNRQLEDSEVELKTALQKEKELNDLKSRFVSIASHEFRTPLSTILSSASLISRYERTEHQGNRLRHIEKIKSAVNNLTGTLSDFLDLTKLEEGKVILNIESIALNNLVEEIFSELSGLVKENIQLIAQIQIRHHYIANNEIRDDARGFFNTDFSIFSFYGFVPAEIEYFA